MSTVPEQDTTALRSPPLLGFWYAGAVSSDLAPGTLKGVVLLSTPILLCRTKDGRVSAMLDLCPHRGMPLSFGRMDEDRVECPYHGWQFEADGRCAVIPSLVSDSPIDPKKICVTSFPCEDLDGYIWVYMGDSRYPDRPIPPIMRHPRPSSPYLMFQHSQMLSSTLDDGVVGLMDPAHGPYVHQSSLWRKPASQHDKAKTFEPIPNGFRMIGHAPSKNSPPYQLLKWMSGGELTTTIDFVLPNQRYEFIQCGSLWVSIRVLMTPITEHETRMDFCAAWNAFRWLPFGTSIFRYFAKGFLAQDKVAMDRQSIGLKYKPPFRLVGDADQQAKWYHKLKAAHVASLQTGQPFDHPLKGPVTLRWRS
jgi:phenylpropionate dioxygenase-like ring-hydroxylating dioxygenase large terminal subunit